MFNSLRKKIDDYKQSKIFNAENCLYKQIKIEKFELNKKIEEITHRISFVAESTSTEHTVIYQVHDYEQKMFAEIKTYFINLGFKVINMEIPELGNDEYMIISWKNN